MVKDLSLEYIEDGISYARYDDPRDNGVIKLGYSIYWEDN
jgi:hypothetical protein